jgi:hypothetical protein
MASTPFGAAKKNVNKASINSKVTDLRDLVRLEKPLTTVAFLILVAPASSYSFIGTYGSLSISIRQVRMTRLLEAAFGPPLVQD